MKHVLLAFACVTVLMAARPAAADPGSGTGDPGAPTVSENGSEKSWFDPTLPGIPSHTAAYTRRNVPRVDPMEALRHE